MLISVEIVLRYLKKYGIVPTGALHVGAHECEELGAYAAMGLVSEDLVWVEALPDKVAQARARGIPNVHCAVVSERDGDEVTFRRTNNDQSSSILELGTHLQEHPSIYVTQELPMTTTTLDTLLATQALSPSKLNIWNFDIQGAELLALRGGEQALQFAQLLYMEVNERELYKGCALLPQLDAYLAERHFTRVHTEMTHAGWGDAVYVRTE